MPRKASHDLVRNRYGVSSLRSPDRGVKGEGVITSGYGMEIKTGGNSGNHTSTSKYLQMAKDNRQSSPMKY